MTRSEVFRILDANLNRSREGLRVAEEVARFVLNDRPLTTALKRARHAIAGALRALPMGYGALVAQRNVRADVGRSSTRREGGRSGTRGLFIANIERAKEALRVLEETSKCVDTRSAERFKKIRFTVYGIEKNALPKLAPVRHHRR